MTNKNKILSSYNFARNSNFVFSEVVTKSQFYDLNLKNYTILDETPNYIFYKLNYLSIKENDIVFTNTETIDNLFKLMSKDNSLENIKLITNQSDKAITLKLFKNKPDCVVNWYSVNVDHKNAALKPIPLGIANNHSPKNLLVDDFKLNPKINDLSDISMYINFQTNTNYLERKNIYSYFKNKNWVEIDSPNLKLDLYKQKLKQHVFVLCPWGNGIDTHRIWETLYSGGIPITKYHHTFSALSDLPILFIDDYENINLDNLDSFLKTVQQNKPKYNKLNIDYWISNIKGNKLSKNNVLKGTESKFNTNIFYVKFRFKKIKNSKLKKILYYLKKVKRLFE
jgi:hypothetical protein